MAADLSKIEQMLRARLGDAVADEAMAQADKEGRARDEVQRLKDEARAGEMPVEQAKGQGVEQVLRARLGDELADEAVAHATQQRERRTVTKAQQAEALAISARRVERGEGQELDADAPPLKPPSTGAAPSPRQERHGRVTPRQSDAAVKQSQRQKRKLGPVFQRRHERNQKRELEQAERMAEKALQSHGIRHHYRPLPKVAFFGAYQGGLDRNGVIALQALAQVNMPQVRMDQVLRAAYDPQGHTPIRDVRVGKRAGQHGYLFDGRIFGSREVRDGSTIDRPGWQEGMRLQSHPGAIRVLQCAVFLWLCKTRTRRRGYSYAVHGFGRGVFGSICQCAKDGLTGHTDGMPGALLALAKAGFIEYGAPPAEKVSSLDRGPSGHAYNVYWFRADAEAVALDSMHARIARLSRLPMLARLLEDPSLIEQRAQGPPREPACFVAGTFSQSDIPF